MRIIIICGAGIVSGKEIITLHLLKGLKERGIDCYCITSSWGSIDFRERLEQLCVPFFILRIGFVSVTLTWSAIRMTLHQLLHVPILYVKYLAIIKKIKPSIIIHTNFHHVFVLYPVLTKAVHLYWSHEIIAQSAFYKKLFNLFNRRISQFVAVSGAVADSLTGFVGARKVDIVRNGILPPSTYTHGRTIGNGFVLAIVGQVVRNKGHEMLFRALKDYRTWKVIPSLWVIGSGDPKFIELLQQLAVDLRIDEIIIWKGFIKDPDKIYEGVDVVLVPSIAPESYPTTVLEAGVRGIPAIVSNVGGLPEMIKDGYNGLIFEIDETESLTRAIVKFLDWDFLAKIRVQAREFGIKNFTVNTFVDQFKQVIDRF